MADGTMTATQARHGTSRDGRPPVDVERLRAALEQSLDGDVRFGAGDRHLYATDASNYRQVPIGVVRPRHADDVVRALAACRRFGAPVTSRGGGTALAGQTTNVAVVIDHSKYLNQVVEIDADQRWARVQPGCVLDDLQAALAPHGLRFGPDPATHNRCTIGGMIGNDSCGVHSVHTGRTADNVLELDVVLYDGTRLAVGPTSDADFERALAAGGRRAEVYRGLRQLRDRYADEVRARFPDIPRRVSGYNLDNLLPENGFDVARALVGSEGTCVVVVEAKLRLVEDPPAKALVVLGYDDIFEAADHVPALLRHQPVGLEGMDHQLVANMRAKGMRTDELTLLPAGNAYLLCELGGADRDDADAKADALMAAVDLPDDHVSRFDDPHQAHRIWEIRESGLGATARIPGKPLTWPGWEDSAVAPDRIGAYLRDLHQLFAQHHLEEVSLYGHFGDGCIHCRIPFDLFSADGVAGFRRFLADAAALVARHGGSLSGEHGDGQARAELLATMFGDELVGAFREFKRIWDPDAGMNPGKVVDPYQVDDNMRLGAGYRPAEPATVFAYPRDDYSFASAQLRCVGVGQCRRDDGGGTMCPSYMVTGEEMHSTRGRARLLFEMLQPDSQLDGWRDDHVREALDLCLACKGCRTDCPVNVDMATYKAEFMHHHYAGRLRPRAAYALGLIYWWSRLASRMPGIANAGLRAPGLGGWLKRAAGVTPQRPAPAYAHETFIDWFRARRRGEGRVDGERVLLWPDTFTNHFHPSVAKATVAVLEDAGYRVELPERLLCCGRPLYDFGMLDLARRQLHQLVDQLQDIVAAGVHIVGMEPSCVATLRDELVEMLPHDSAARRISQASHTLAEFLVDIADYTPPRLERTAVVHGHCHHKAIMEFGADGRLLDAMGLDWRELDAGCCGLAGSFGFEAGDHYDVSVAAGERKLLPAVRDADDATLILADGFSCRTQIEHLQPRRRALHLAEVIRLAGDYGPAGPPTDRPPEAVTRGDGTRGFGRKDRRAAAVVAMAVIGVALARRARH